jgi:hypothetical protein
MWEFDWDHEKLMQNVEKSWITKSLTLQRQSTPKDVAQ